MYPKLLEQTAQNETPRFRFTLPKPYSDWQRVLMTSDVKFAMFVCGTKTGKAILLDEWIPTPQGWRKMRDIVAGDFVFSETGQPIRVLFETDPMLNRKCYRVSFSDGATVDCDAEHLWVTETNAERKNKSRGLWQDRPATAKTTEQIKKSIRATVGGTLRANHFIKCLSAPLEYPDHPVPIDPYLLGVWLGDGSSTNGLLHINVNDRDICKRIALRNNIYQVGDPLNWRVSGLTTELKKHNLIGKDFVPHEYLRNSFDVRLSFLQGLMDSDGAIDTRGRCSFYSSKKLLSDAVYELATGLGIRCTRTEKIGKLNGKEYLPCHMVNFSTTLPVFFTKRKAEKLPLSLKKADYRSIVSVEEIKSQPVKCIRVDNPSHLFLVGRACIPTHNTLAGACKIIQSSFVARRDAAALYRIIAPTYSLSGLTYKYIRRLCPDNFPQANGQTTEEYRKACEAWARIRPLTTESKMRLLWPHNGALIQCTHAQDPETTIEGERTHGNIMDECSKMKESAFASVYSTTTQTGGWIRAYTTPRGKNWVFKKYCECLNEMELARLNNRPPTMIAMTASTIDNPFVPRESIEQARKMLPDRIFRQLYMAEFVDDGSVFIGYRECIFGQELDANLSGWQVEDSKTRTVVIGADWAKRVDYTAFIAIEITDRPRIVGFRHLREIPYSQSVRELNAFIKKFGEVLLVRHDRTGVGDVIEEMLLNLDCEISPVVFTHETKSHMVDQWSVAIQAHQVQVPNWGPLTQEHDHYDVRTNQLGKPIFGASSGQHDDLVTACFLAWSAYLETRDQDYDIVSLDDMTAEIGFEKREDSIDSWYASLIEDAEDD